MLQCVHTMKHHFEKAYKNLKVAFSEHRAISVLFSILIVVLLGTIVYGQYRISHLNSALQASSARISSIDAKFSSSTVQLLELITQTHNSLSGELDQEKKKSTALTQQLGTYQQQVSSVTGTIDTLQRLSKTDPQLLQKYSKIFFLNEYYAPARLTEIPSDYRYSDAKVLKFQADVWPHLKQLIDDAKSANVSMFVFSAYRSFNEQSALKKDYKITYGAGTANQFSADQGYSEHQLGTTLDFIAPGLGGVLDGFDDTKAYSWLQANAYKYGFVLSYPKNNTFYVFEPWHWRFVALVLCH